MLPSPEDTAVILGAEPAVDLGSRRRVLLAVGVQAVEVTGHVRVARELRSQHGGGGSDVAERGVGLFVFPAQVEAGGPERSRGSWRWKMFCMSTTRRPSR